MNLIPGWQGIIGSAGRTGVRGAVTWDPAQKHPDIVLSNENLTAADGRTVGSATISTRSTKGRSSAAGKIYFECVQPVWTPQDTWMTGLIASTIPITNENIYPGGEAGDAEHGFSISNMGYGNMQVLHDRTSTNCLASLGPGDTLGVAVDFGLGTMFMQTTQNGWVADTGAPGSGPGLLFTKTAEMFIYCGLTKRIDVTMTLKAKAPFNLTPPGGYDAWMMPVDSAGMIG